MRSHSSSLPASGNALDIVEELQLRRWARENYVPPEERTDDWHPVVHEEMQSKDAELIIGSRIREPFRSYVPLLPLPPQQWHSRHFLPEEPKLMQQPTALQNMVSPDGTQTLSAP